MGPTWLGGYQSKLFQCSLICFIILFPLLNKNEYVEIPVFPIKFGGVSKQKLWGPQRFFLKKGRCCRKGLEKTAMEHFSINVLLSSWMSIYINESLLGF